VTRPTAWRLLVDPPGDGAWDMAVDEALLTSCSRAEGRVPTTLRLYGWETPTLSLGRGQIGEACCDRRYLRRHGIDLVRRPTGGLAVLHDAERTYAVVGSLRRPPFEGGVSATYRRIAAALAGAMRNLGLDARSVGAEGSRRAPRPRTDDPSCFALTSSHEIAVDGRKLIGSAQLRRREAFLQHGSILIDLDLAGLTGALGAAPSGAGARFTGLSAALGRRPTTSEIDGALVDAFRANFGCGVERGELTAAERQRAVELYSWKYLSAAWTLRGKRDRRELRLGPRLG